MREIVDRLKRVAVPGIMFYNQIDTMMTLLSQVQGMNNVPGILLKMRKLLNDHEAFQIHKELMSVVEEEYAEKYLRQYCKVSYEFNKLCMMTDSEIMIMEIIE